MAATKTRTGSFSRNLSAVSSPETPGVKRGPNGTFLVSSGIPDLDRIVGGGFTLGSLVMVMEDAEAPHHMLLLRNFMAQGLIHNQPLLYASPSKDPRGFLGTLPGPSSSKDDKSHNHAPEQDNGLRIAWQYKKYFDENQQNFNGNSQKPSFFFFLFFFFFFPTSIFMVEIGKLVGWTSSCYFSAVNKQDFSNEFDLRKPLERHFFSGQHVDCVSINDSPSVSAVCDRCASFLSQFPRNDGGISFSGRIAIQSLCAPQCEYSHKEWDLLSFVQSLKSKLRSANAVAVITFPPSLLSPSMSKRLQHMADTLLSVRAIPDEDKELAKLLTGYHDMVGFLNVHKIARINTQVPAILEATTFSIKLQKRRFLVLECLNQAPIDGSSGTSYGTSGSCSSSSRNVTLDF